MKPQREYTVAEFRAGKIPGLKKGKTRPRAPRALKLVTVDRLEFVMPIVLVSEANEHEHQMTRHRRKNEQQDEVRGMLRWVPWCPVPPPWNVTITRLSVADKMDTDNEAGSGKHVRDEVARWLGCGDSKSDPVRWTVTWEESALPGTRVTIETRKAK